MSTVLGAGRLLVLLSVLMAASFVASAALAASSSPWDVPAAPIPDMSSWAQDPVWQQARAQAEAAAVAQRAAVNSPSADAQRDRSATAFDDLSRPEAQELAQQTFPDLMAAPVDALGLPAGAHVTSYVSATEARVEDAHGKRLLLESTAPFATKDEDSGQLSKVDLSLSSDGGALLPANPVVDVELPDSAAAALTLPDSGLGVSLADGANVTGDVEHDRVFYGEVSTDTDYITVAQRQGAQVMWQLRSPQATESPSLDLDLPAGEHARLTSALTGASSDENPSVQIVTDDNTVVNTIAAPSAVDADGVSVPARYRLDGSRLSVDVPHREQQIKYPVLVDPAINEVWGGTDWYNSGAGQGGVMAGQWGFTATEGGLGNPWFLQNNNSPTGYGMAIESWPGAFLYTAGAGAFYHWSAPPYTNIAGVWFDGFYHRSEGDHLFAGITGPYGWETVRDIPYDTDYEQSSQTPNPAWELSSVNFGVFEDMTTTHPVPGWVAVRGVSILVGDTRPPDDVHLNWIHFDDHDFGAIAPGSDGVTRMPWVNSATSIQFQTVVHDPGLGLQHVGVMDAANNWAGNAWHSGCTGNRTSPCPANITATQTITTTRGANNYRPVGIDIAGNVQFGPTYQLRIDGDNPLITLSGNAADAAAAGLPLTSSDQPSVHLSVTDGSTASNATYQSGVKHVITTLDGAVVNDWTNQNGDGTNNDYNPTFQLTPRSDLVTHTLTVQAWDYVGRPGTKTLTFYTNGVPMTLNDTDRGTDLADTVADGDYGSLGAPDPCVDGSCDSTPVASEASTGGGGVGGSDFVWGISDQNLVGMADTLPAPDGTANTTPNPQWPKFDDLRHTTSGTPSKLKAARLVTPYNVVTVTNPDGSPTDEEKRVVRWLDRTKALGLEPLISFEHIKYGYDRTLKSDDTPVNNPLPTDAQYTAAIDAFLAKYKAKYNLSHFTAWNEPNHSTQPTQQWDKKPAGWPTSPAPPNLTSNFGAAMAGRYWRILRKKCSGCVVAAGDLLDDKGFKFTGGWGSTYNRYLYQNPTVWAFHPYGGMASGSITSLRALISATASTTAHVWVTEVGPIFEQTVRGVDTVPDPQTVWNHYLTWMNNLSSVGTRLTRFYYFEFQGDKAWDTGLIDFNGSSAPASHWRSFVMCDIKTRLAATTC